MKRILLLNGGNITPLPPLIFQRPLLSSAGTENERIYHPKDQMTIAVIPFLSLGSRNLIPANNDSQAGAKFNHVSRLMFP